MTVLSNANMKTAENSRRATLLHPERRSGHRDSLTFARASMNSSCCIQVW